GPLSYVGGNINTRASGPHALRHGAIHNYLRHVRIITGAGETVDTRDRTTLPPRLRDGLFELARTLRHDTEMLDRLELRRSFKWASGYELLALADHGDDPVAALPRLVAGSVGTLGILTEAVLASEPLPSERGALLVRFASAQAACRAAGWMRTRAAAIEIVSRSALDLLRRHTDVLAGDDESAALLIVEYSGPGALESVERAARALDARDLVGEPVRASTDDEIDAIWAARKALLPVVRRYASTGFVPYSVVNDVGVAPERLGELLAGAEEIFDRYGLDAPIYGHAGSGNLHLRPLFPTGNRELVARVANDVYGLVCRLGGTVTAEHGMGRLRAPFLRAEWGDRIVDLMTEVKRLFDPDGLLNPGVMVPARDGEAGTPPWGGDLRL
ncbi:MAG: FAD-binding oxidoreductase, partial [Spirochaetota bacterium]